MKSSFSFVHVNNLWQLTNASWMEKEYRIVGTSPFISKKVCEDDVEMLIDRLDDVIFLVEFNSGRVNVANTNDCNDGYKSYDMNGNEFKSYTSNDNEYKNIIGNKTSYKLGDYVILEADRGIDCGEIIAKINKRKYKTLMHRIDKNLCNKELHPKKIYRHATHDDLKVIETKTKREKVALIDCRNRVKNEMLNMVINKCEYQWYMNKLTFFFRSDYKIDFRELVKALYKEYKIRMWMYAVEESRNHHLKELLSND